MAGFANVFLAISLFFVILKPQINLIPQRTNEVFLFQKDSLKIALQTIKEKPIFGSGQGTFAYDFSKYKNADLNKTSLWNSIFDKGTSEAINVLATTGVLGAAAFLLLMAAFVFYGLKFLIFSKNKNDESGESRQLVWILSLGLFSCFCAQIASYFLYNSDITLSFVYFFIIAALSVLTAKNKKIYELKPSSLATLAITFIFTLVFIFGLGILVLDGQRYSAEVSYFKGLSAWQNGQRSDGVKNMEIAASKNSSSDLYFRQLSQAYLVLLQDETQKIGNMSPSQEQSKTIQALITNSINAAKIATDISPNNVINWSTRGMVYQNLTGATTDAQDWAIKSYEKALELSPLDPYLLTQRGAVYYQKKDYQNAKQDLEKAVELKSDYQNAIYLLGLVYDQLSQKDKAIEMFNNLLKLNPQDPNIQKILGNLNAGLPALQTSAPVVATQPTVETPAVPNPKTKK